jgi:cytochrome P450
MVRSPISIITAGPSGRDMWKELSAIRSDTTGFLGRMHQRFGDVVQYPVPVPAFSITQAEAVDRVLRTNARNYTKQTLQFESLKLVTGEGLLTADGEIWRNHRRILQPAFHRTTQNLVLDAIEDSYSTWSTQWRKENSIELAEAMQHITLEVVGRSLFGTSLSADADVIASATIKALKVVVAKARTPLPIPPTVPTPNNIRLRRALRTLDRAVAQLLQAPPSHPDAFITLLREAHEDDPIRFDVTAIRDEIVTFIVAGHETVAAAMTWALVKLQQNPQHLERATAEARGVNNTRDLSEIPFVVSAFAETLRLYPPAWLITRTSIESDEIAGVEIPPRSLIIMSPYLMHRGSVWEHPEDFRPERFTATQDSVARADYLPFGLGARLCIGRDMALVEGPLLLASLLRDFEILPQTDFSRVPMQQGVTLHPAKALPVRLLGL